MKILHIILLSVYSFNTFAADLVGEKEKVQIEKIVANAESSTSPDKLFVAGDSGLSIFYHLDDIKNLLKFSWYLVGTNEADLATVQKYLIRTNPDRSAEEFKLHTIGHSKALMIFFEMIKQKDLLRRVQLVRSQLDLEIENTFWQATDPNKPMISLLPYSQLPYEDEDTETVMVKYKPQFTECKPLKYIKVQLFAIAKNMDHPDLQVYFDSLNRVITFKNHKIWPLGSGSWLDVKEMLGDEKLTQKQSEFYELTGIDDKTYQVISFGNEANSSNAKEPASKYLDIHKYIRGNSKLLEDGKLTFAYVEAPFWQVAKKFAIRNATAKERAQYQKKMDLIDNVTDSHNVHQVALPLMIESITKNEAVMTLFAAILYNNEMRDHLFSMAKEQHPWASWKNYPFSETDMRNDGEYEINNISPLSLFLNEAYNMAELLTGCMEKELANRLVNVGKHFHEIFGGELVAGQDSSDKSIEYALAMALMASSEPKLAPSLNQNSHFKDLLGKVSEDQKASAAQLISSIQELRKLTPKLVEEENARREKENQLIDAHNANIDTQCAAIAKTIDAAFADVN